mgnify:CR=1 FL=1
MDVSSARILDGKGLAKKIQAEIGTRVAEIRSQNQRPPGLAVLMVGEDPASATYVRNKEKACDRLGIASFGRHFPTETTQQELESAIAQLNEDPQIDGILVQLPLPEHLNAVQALYQIDPQKDVDGLHPTNMGNLLRGEPSLRSCTPSGVMRLLQEYGIDPQGQRAVVVGRSILVGKPMALMLLDANATVTMAHSHTQDLASLTREADILVAAVGHPLMFGADAVKPGATVIDVGINRVYDEQAGKARLIGDVDFAAVKEKASYMTPVPGGIGPMTVTMLLHNTLQSYVHRTGVGST